MPDRKKIMGCTSPPPYPHQMEGPGGEIFELDICPARLVEPDVLELVNRFFTANQSVSYSEQKKLSLPHLQAIECLKGYLQQYQESKRPKVPARG